MGTDGYGRARVDAKCLKLILNQSKIISGTYFIPFPESLTHLRSPKRPSKAGNGQNITYSNAFNCVQNDLKTSQKTFDGHNQLRLTLGNVPCDFEQLLFFSPTKYWGWVRMGTDGHGRMDKHLGQYTDGYRRARRDGQTPRIVYRWVRTGTDEWTNT